jgi:hypothetical protein
VIEESKLPARVVMTRSITLHTGAFGQDALKARLNGGTRSAVVRTAVLYYLSDRALERPGWRVPEFIVAAARSEQQINVELDDATYLDLEEEAARQGVALELLAEHALVYFLADLDSGRVSDRIGDALDEER